MAMKRYSVSIVWSVLVFVGWTAVNADAQAIVDELEATTLKNLAVIIAVLFGSIYTLILVFVLGPAIWAVNNLAVRVAREGFGQDTEIEVKAWIAENGLRPTAFQQGIQVFAALGPLLTGPILGLMSFVG